MAVTLTALYKLPNLGTQDATVGTQDWAYLNRIKTNENSVAPDGCAIPTWGTFDYIDLVRASLVKGGVIQTGVNKASSNPRVDTNPNIVLGGTADLWSTTLSVAEVTASDFGIAISYGDEAVMGSPKTKYLIARDFQFAIPSTSTINGVQARIDHKSYGVGGGGAQSVAVDEVEMQITFTWAPEAKTSGSGGGYVFIPDHGQPKPQKTIRWFVFDSEGNYLREWKDVSSELSLHTEVNKSLYNIDVQLARNPFDEQTDIVPWELEQGGFLTDELYDLQLSFDAASSIGLGPGTDVQENNIVKVKAFYGELENLLWEDGTPALTEDYNPFYLENDSLDGHDIYSGFIQDWEADLGGNDSVSVYLMNDAEELANIMLETDETILINNPLVKGEIGVAGSGFDDNVKLAQTFTMPSTKKVSRIGLFAKSGYENFPTTFNVSLYEGSNVNAPGTLLAATTLTVENYESYQEINFSFPNPITLTSGQPYLFIIDSAFYKTGGAGTYPVYFATNSDYASGTGYVETNSVFPLTDIGGVDIAFNVWEAGLDTTVSYNSMDPSDIARKIIDFARGQGANINYTADSIQDTGTEVSITFNTNTVAEALEKIIDLCPTDWYWTYDPGTNLYSLKLLSATPVRKFTNRGDIINLKIRKSLTKLINQVYFSGGGTPALFRKTTDIVSRNTYRKALIKLSDSRVTDDDTALIMSQAQIDRYKNPIYVVSATIGGEHPEPIENIELGEKIGFLNYGNFIDNLELQICGITYNLDTVSLDLGVILPKVTKRIEDIRRNLDVIQQENNPVEPDE